MGESILRSKSYDFAIRIVGIVKTLQNDQREFVLSKQLLRSGTAVGALISEAEFGQSRADFTHKLSIALKEANETRYWLNLLHDTGYLDGKPFNELFEHCTDLIRILVACGSLISVDRLGLNFSLFTSHFSLLSFFTSFHFSLLVFHFSLLRLCSAQHNFLI